MKCPPREFYLACRWAMLLSIFGLWTSAHGQIGTGWTQKTYGEILEPETNDVLVTISPVPSFFFIKQNDFCTYTNSGGVETFNLWNPDSNRIEVRIKNDYTNGTQQFEGDVKLLPPTDNESLMQIFGSDGNGNATLLMLRGYAANGGSLEHYGDTVLATNIYNTWVHVNVIHVNGQYAQAYINGVLAGQWTRGSNSVASHYFKYGCYGTLTTPSAGVQWKNVKFFSGGIPPGPKLGIHADRGSLNLSASGGIINEPFVLLCATNAALPTAKWLPVLSSNFGSAGTFNWATNVGTPAPSRQFFLLSESLN